MTERTYPNYLTGNSPTTPTLSGYAASARQLAEEKLYTCINTNKHHIMLLTKEESYDVLECLGEFGRDGSQPEGLFSDIAPEDVWNYAEQTATYSGNAKDLYSAADLVRKLGGFGIAATIYVGRNGEQFIKISGYPGIRKILNGTRYKLNNVKIVQIGLGTSGINNAIVSGARWNIYASFAFRTVELIFSDKYDTADFLGDITADMAKTIIVAAGTRAFSFLIVAGTATSIGLTFFAVAIVLVVVTFSLNEIDKEYGLSEKIIAKIRELEARSPRISDTLGMNSQLLNKNI
ncbi:hypothetical protein [Yersinia aldovae]|uniref:hypothetical protein n=1 Tax=Yersinia aldovae TaxID=29483 RepID=UPI0011A4E6C9|nr:hypothetical protein [Yersinia aldovae]